MLLSVLAMKRKSVDIYYNAKDEKKGDGMLERSYYGIHGLGFHDVV